MQTYPRFWACLKFESMDTKKYVAEISANQNVVESLATLNAYKSELLRGCKDSEYLSAKETFEAAKAALKKLENKVILGDELYLNLQTECVRTAVSEFSHTHKLPSFFAWFDTNGKDKQVKVIDTQQKLGSRLRDLHESFAAGTKVARKKKASVDELQQQILELQKKLAEAQGAR